MPPPPPRGPKTKNLADIHDQWVKFDEKMPKYLNWFFQCSVTLNRSSAKPPITLYQPWANTSFFNRQIYSVCFIRGGRPILEKNMRYRGATAVLYDYMYYYLRQIYYWSI